MTRLINAVTIPATVIILVIMQTASATKSNHWLSIDSIEQAYIPTRPQALEKLIVQALKAMPSDYIPRTEHLLEDGKPRYTNRLMLEDSPYLIQHAHNTMDWHAWGEQAFALAKAQNKPVFLSIGYSTCHWCHVMEKESFENATIADFINRNFIAIKVDRERRPDIDRLYINALIHMTGDGGWPLSSFLTPDGKPFQSGNYYKPAKFLELLQKVSVQWTEQQAALTAQADQIAQAVEKMGLAEKSATQLSDNAVSQAVKNMISDHDTENGGFGGRPKFPQESKLMLLLNDAMRNHDPAALEVLNNSLDAMGRGGIYDQVGGGFHRYSVRRHWNKPHFEKMLYNQAHLARAYLRGWYLTGNPVYRRITIQTLDYVLRDMTAANGAFYSATDADSEGKEGLFFLWSTAELQAVLSEEDAQLAIALYDVGDDGYFGDRNVLHIPESLQAYADKHDMTLPHFFERLDGILKQLYLAREQREHPLRDEKFITAWNGMMISTLAEAGMLLNEPRYIDAAAAAAEFIWDNNYRRSGKLWRIHLNGRSSIEAQQEDYAFYAEGLLKLYDASANKLWLKRARAITQAMVEQFWDIEHGGFFMTVEQQQVTSMGRPRDGGDDDRMPSGNSMALRVLNMLEARTDDPDYGKKANATLATFAGSINHQPEAYGYMLASASDARVGETGPLQYAARGAIRILARQTGLDQVALDISIADGWHINSDQPLQDYLIATGFSINDPSKAWSVNSIQYPSAHTQVLGFQYEPLSLFEGDIQIQMDLNRDEESSRILPLRLRLQACSDRLCLPPETLNLQLAMQISSSNLPD